MSKRRKPRIPKYTYDADKAVERFIPQYELETGDKGWTLMKVAAWAISKGLWEQQKSNAVHELAKRLGRAAAKATFVDTTTNETVRKYHAYRIGEDQPMLWSPIYAISRDNMKYSINARRDKAVATSVKAIVDTEHFNRNYNAGDPITFETDLTQDVKEKRLPDLYDDSGPPDEPTPV